MSDYIKREDAIKEANTWSMFGNDNLESRLKRLPSADVVEVVRCKNCKGYAPADETYGTCYAYKGVYGKIKPTDYCSYGKRKEKENETRNTCE